jgi:hypothetical protein
LPWLRLTINYFEIRKGEIRRLSVPLSSKTDSTSFPSVILNRRMPFTFLIVYSRIKNAAGRDIFNERPTKEDTAVALDAPKKLPSQAIVHTSIGDIHLTLFPQYAPKAVENFIGLSLQFYL